MYDYALHRGRKHYCHYCLLLFKDYNVNFKDCFKSNGKKGLRSP